MLEYLHRGTDLFNITVTHDDNPVRQSHRLNLVMGNVDDGILYLMVKLFDLQPHLGAQFGIQIGEGFVKQIDRGTTHNCPSHRHPLPLSPR